MFGTSGIRGVYGEDVTDELVMKISNLFSDCDIAVGRDIRKSGTALRDSAFKGINSAGFNAVDLGIVPTPTVALASMKYGKGIMVTASHNPPEHNGIKLMENGREITAAEGDILVKKYNAGEYYEGRKGDVLQNDTIADEHIEMILGMVKPEKNLKVVVDCNGATYSITPRVLGELGCQVISINTSSSEFFRPSEPKEKNLSSLMSAVKVTGADLGIAHDCDGDRCVIADRTGRILQMDVQLAMMIEEEMKKSGNKTIAATVEASLLIRETVENLKGKITITPVGSTYLALEMEKHNAFFGGEPCGEYIYHDGVRVPDGVLSAAKFVELASKYDISELKNRYSSYPIIREKYPVKDRKASMEKIRKAVSADYKFNKMDGLRVDEDDGWFLIRPSGTEKIIRLTMEYKDEKKLEEKRKEIEELIKKNLD